MWYHAFIKYYHVSSAIISHSLAIISWSSIIIYHHLPSFVTISFSSRIYLSSPIIIHHIYHHLSQITYNSEKVKTWVLSFIFEGFLYFSHWENEFAKVAWPRCFRLSCANVASKASLRAMAGPSFEWDWVGGRCKLVTDSAPVSLLKGDIVVGEAQHQLKGFKRSLFDGLARISPIHSVLTRNQLDKQTNQIWSIHR